MNTILKNLRLENGYTQEEMAEFLGYKDKSGYNHLEKGGVKLSMERALTLSKIFKVEPIIFFIQKVEETKT